MLAIGLKRERQILKYLAIENPPRLLPSPRLVFIVLGFPSGCVEGMVVAFFTLGARASELLKLKWQT